MDDAPHIVEPPAGLGHNQPPEPSAFEAHKVHLEDWYDEAKNWLDGEPIMDDAQAEAVEALLDTLRAGWNAADESRKLENEPHRTAIDEIQARYNPILAKAKTAQDACKSALTKWRAGLAAEKAEAAKIAQAEADERTRLAREAAGSLDTSNLSEIERAEALIKDAKKAAKGATRAAKTAATGLGMRSYFTPALTDGNAAARHYWSTNRDACEAFFLSLAKTDVLAGKRQIPGFRIDEERRAV